MYGEDPPDPKAESVMEASGQIMVSPVRAMMERGVGSLITKEVV
jgi:hypothetical protein